MHSCTRNTMFALAALAGSSLALSSALADPPVTRADTNKHSSSSDHAQPDTNNRGAMKAKAGKNFVSGDKLVGMSVHNGQDKSLGTIEDLVIDRGSGAIKFVVMKSGSVMGMGGRTLAIPYSSFGWDNVDKQVTLNATEDAVKTWPEFDKDAWARGDRSGDWYARGIGRDYGNYKTSPWPTDTRATTEQLKGKVTNFSRHTSAEGQEELMVTVTTPTGETRDVVLGPSWYVAGNNSIAFYREAPIEVTVFSVDRGGQPVMLARSANINGKQLDFYSTEGRAEWAPREGETPKNAALSMPFVLYSEVDGKAVDCRGQDCGKVNDLLVECSSGRASFLVVDPDENFLGIADENRLVPWTIMTRSFDGKVHLDADKQMLVNGPKPPSELKTFSQDNQDARVYEAYSTGPASEYRVKR